ncbi:hypothetical protein N0V88_006966 [Collariella sp. IMI 366227]|nr:hypothetical protein N0V88_006966 [Collariella sp. IMI 366227]
MPLQPGQPLLAPPLKRLHPNLLKTTYHLGDSSNHTQLCVTFQSHLFSKSKPSTIIHSGPDASFPALAYLTKEGTFSDNTYVHIPNTVGGGEEGEETVVHFRSNVVSGGGWKNIIHRFSMDLGATKRTEDFEWKMVTFGMKSEDGSYGFELRHLRDGGAPEVVATLGMGKMSLSKKFTWRLVGDGAKGVFGREWEMVALATAVRTERLEIDRLSASAS